MNGKGRGEDGGWKEGWRKQERLHKGTGEERMKEGKGKDRKGEKGNR